MTSTAGRPLVDATFRLPFAFTVPDLLYERELKDHGGPEFIRLGQRAIRCLLHHQQERLGAALRVLALINDPAGDMGLWSSYPHTCDILCEVGCDDAEIEATVAAKVLHAEIAES